MTTPDAAEVVAALQARLAARHGTAELIQTHISWVLLAGPYAYKLKKPVRFGFLDFSTLDARHHFCEEELRLNRRLAPALYIGVRPVYGGDDGPSLDRPGPVIEFALQMHRMPPGSLASERLSRGELYPQHLARFAQRLAQFHRDAAASPPDAGFGRAARVRDDALHAVDALAAIGDAAACKRLRAWLDARARVLAPRWDARADRGFVRELHGDLHLDNVLVLEDDVTAFDCIEFDPALRWIDPMNDLGFLLMDLCARGRRDLAFGCLAAYLEASGDHEGVPVLPFYLVYRAVVRALVTALRERGGHAAAGPGTAAYLALAEALCAPPRPALLITHGLPGSGKTHASQALLEAAGALRWRSDVERKRLAGLAALDDSRRSGDLYTAAATDATYERLAMLAALSLDAGFPTIVDAAFLQHAQRQRMRELAADRGVPFAILDCRASDATLRARLRQRKAGGLDASEADEAVLDWLATRAHALSAEERAVALPVGPDGPIDAPALAKRWSAAPVPASCT